jgi:prepilin-type N-terminal cleavage/methylation domain-containing protein
MKRRNAGFTLVEMMVALAIGGIMTAMAVPNFNQMREGYRLRAATYEVFTALQRARSEAVKRNNNYRFSLVNGTTYRLHDDANNDGVINTGETVTQKNISLEAQGTQMYFYCWTWTGSGWQWATALNFAPDGTSGDMSWVAVANAQWEYKWIQISSTGRIQVL